MSTSTKISMKDTFGFNVKGKRKDAQSDFSMDFHSYDHGRVTGKATGCEYVFAVGQSGATTMNVKVYDNSKATDCDGWLLRIFDLSLSGVTLTYMENGVIVGRGYVSDLAYFTEEDYPREAIEDGYVDSCFPTKRWDDDMGLFVKVEFRITPRKVK